MTDRKLIFSYVHSLNTSFEWDPLDDELVTIPVRRYKGLDITQYACEPSFSGKEFYKYSFLINISELKKIKEKVDANLSKNLINSEDSNPVILFNKLNLDRYLLIIFLYKGFIEGNVFKHLEYYFQKNYGEILKDFKEFSFCNPFEDVFPFNLPIDLEEIPVIVNTSSLYSGGRLNFKDLKEVSRLEKKNLLTVLTRLELGSLLENIEEVSKRVSLYFLILRSSKDALSKGNPH